MACGCMSKQLKPQCAGLLEGVPLHTFDLDLMPTGMRLAPSCLLGVCVASFVAGRQNLQPKTSKQGSSQHLRSLQPHIMQALWYVFNAGFSGMLTPIKSNQTRDDITDSWNDMAALQACSLRCGKEGKRPFGVICWKQQACWRACYELAFPPLHPSPAMPSGRCAASLG